MLYYKEKVVPAQLALSHELEAQLSLRRKDIRYPLNWGQNGPNSYSG
jgi:hypothetical protein